MGVSFEVGLLPQGPIAGVAELAAFAEASGFEGVWVADSQSVFREAYTALALCAAQTRKVRLATGVTNPLTRHPAVTASAIATLHEFSGGRAVLGIGVGESAVHTVGRKPARLQELEEAVLTIRGLLQGKPVTFQGKEIRMAWPAPSVPIYIAASGPKSLRLAGRVADGVLLQAGSDPQLVSHGIRKVREGVEEAGRDPAEVRLCVRLACAVSDDRARAREEVKGYAAVAAKTVLSSVPPEVMPEDLRPDVEEMKARYDYYEHAKSTAKHTDLITDRILDAIAIAGTPEEAVPRFRALLDLGVDRFVIPITTRDPKQTMRALAEQILPKLA